MAGPRGTEARDESDAPDRAELGGAYGPHLWQLRAVRDLCWIAAVAGLGWIVLALPSVFLPLLIALFLAYLVDPLLEGCRRRLRLPRWATALLLVLLLAGGIAWAGARLLPLLIGQIVDLVEQLPDYFQQLGRSIEQSLRLELPTAAVEQRLRAAVDEIRSNPTEFLDLVWRGSDSAINFVAGAFTVTTSAAVLFVLIPFYFVFLCAGYPEISAWGKQFLPDSRRERILSLLAKMDEVVGAYFRGRFVIALLMGAMFALGWMLVGVPYWFLLGVGTGLLSIVPYAAVVGLPIACLLGYLEHPDAGLLANVLWPAVVYAVVQVLEGWILTPWLQGKEMNMGFVSITLVVILGSAVAGVLGMLLAIPLAACAKVLFEELVAPRWRAWARAH